MNSPRSTSPRPTQHGPIVGAAQLEIGVGDEPHGVVLDAQRSRNIEMDVVPKRNRGLDRGRHLSARAAGEIDEPAAGIKTARVDRAAHGDVARQGGRVDGPLQVEIGVDDRAHSLRVPQPHVLSAHRHVEASGPVSLDADAAAEAHRAAAQLRGHLVERHAARIEADDARDILECMRQIEVTDAAGVDRHRAGDDRRAHRAVERRFNGRLPGAADVRHEALEDAETRGAVGAHRDSLVVQVDDARDVELCLVADQPHVGHADRVPIERHADRHGVSQAVVKETEVEFIDGRVDHEVIDVRQLAHHADVAARDRSGVRRELRIERTKIRVERRVGHVEREVGVHLLAERDGAGSRDRQARRCRFQLQGHHVVADVDVACNGADAFVGDEEVAHGAVHVVPRRVERAAAAGGEVQQP